MAKDHLVELGSGFWNVRGSFKLLSLVEIGTQCSLVQLASGGFVLLDAYAFTGAPEREIARLTHNGQAIEAILNLHPYHTKHVREVAARYPHARLYGTARHVAQCPDLPWQPERTESEACASLFADDLALLVPAGVSLVTSDEKVHFGSVLAHHLASRTLHVDDTLTWVDLPLVRGLRFHPTLRWALEPRAGASEAFRQWARELAARCDQVDHLCTAHMRALPPTTQAGVPMAWGERVREALADVEDILQRHEADHA